MARLFYAWPEEWVDVQLCDFGCTLDVFVRHGDEWRRKQFAHSEFDLARPWALAAHAELVDRAKRIAAVTKVLNQ